jgi:hypothetical protein
MTEHRGPYKTLNKLHPYKCPICGGEDGCKPTGGQMGQEMSLTADDWEELYNFLHDVYFPFVHKLMYRARMRNKSPKIYPIPLTME